MKIAFPARLVAACVVAVTCFASQCFASSDYLLEIDDIVGDSKTGGVDIIAYSHDVKSPRDAASGQATGRAASGGGGGTGKVSMSDISFSTRMGKASPQLMQACATGKHFTKATLTCRKSGGGTTQTYLKITMSDCLVSSFASTGNSADDAPVETFSLNFTKIEFEFIDSSGQSTKVSWDLAKGTRA